MKILIVTLRQPNSQKIQERILTALETFSSEEWINRLVIMRDTTMSTWRTEKSEEATS